MDMCDYCWLACAHEVHDWAVFMFVVLLSQLTEHADCVLPVDNQSLIDIRDQMQPPAGEHPRGLGEAAGTGGRSKSQSSLPSLPQHAPRKMSRAEGFQDMNAILARLLINLTASMRFAGDLNVDLNEITTNLVPFPRLHYLTSSLRWVRKGKQGARRDEGRLRERGGLGSGCLLRLCLFFGSSVTSLTSRHPHALLKAPWMYPTDYPTIQCIWPCDGVFSPLVHDREGKLGVRTVNASHQLKQICTGAFARRNQLLKTDPRSGE